MSGRAHKGRSRVLFLVQDLNAAGAQAHVVDLAAGLVRRGHECEVVTFLNGDALAERLPGSDVARTHMPRRWPLDPGLVDRLARRFADGGIGTVVAALDWAYVYAALAAARAGGGLRLIDVVHLTACSGSKERIRGSLCHRWLRAADEVVFVADAQMREFTARVALDSARCTVIPNGVDTERFAPDPGARSARRREWKVATGEVVAGMVARFRPEKRHDLAIEALAAARQAGAAVRLVCVGDGPRLAAARAHADRLGVAGAVTCLGATRDVASLYPGFDVSLSSSDSEAMSISTLESLACGVPVITTRVGGQAEVVGDGRCGFVVPRRDVGSLARGLVACCADRERLREMGAAGRARAEQVFGLDAMVEKYSALIRGSAEEVA